ncbi:cellobiose dehydrogenase [Podospora aff. communis PSN243]|uniref:Cellobiose dehydrogenase n=1 Tax=Podospora aff. communis PSN243 TaxID=3040156 RepID=A0AAV9GL66_9PEZI|nr:cellobiose dehydrogenase [Podospora aff. communis PSN243]
MYWTILGFWAALMLRAASAAQERIFQDPDTKLSFWQTYEPYKLDSGKGIVFRVAVPEATSGTAFDTVVQMVVPNEVGWAGLGWGGGMSQNPLLVVFRNQANNGVLASSRWANGHVTPNAYTGATYTVYKSGTKINNTHWQVTAKCTGCSTWTQRDGKKGSINPKGNNRFGWAYSLKKPTNPNSATSAIPVHDLGQYFTLDVGKGVNKEFPALVGRLQ